MASITSAAGLVSLLDETDETLIHYALVKLDLAVGTFWAEISESLTKIEILYENKSFNHYRLAGLLAAKTYYHLGALGASTCFALGAGDLFDLNSKSEFVETIIAQCIDCYIAKRSKGDLSHAATIAPESREEFFASLEKVVECMFHRCIQDKEYKQAIGIALESRRLDVIETVANAGDKHDLLKYVLDSSIKFVPDQEFRALVLRLLLKIYSELEEPDFFSMTICNVLLKESKNVAEILNELVKKTERHKLIALQLAFDIEECASQDFLTHVSEALEDSSLAARLRNVLSGQVTIQVHLEFLHRNNNADLQILKLSKNAIESRNSLNHASITFANALMNAGTTNDQFLRDNLDWLSRANNWSKFSATAALGVIHKGHLSQSMKLLQPYLPQNGVSSSVYSEGGALFALGLLNANHSLPLEYLCDSLKKTSNEVIQHGACLGIGAAGMATANATIYDDLKAVLYQDNAVASDAAALGMGLLMTGTGDKIIIDEMLAYARETQHERIIRSLSIGMALVMYGREDGAWSTIEIVLADKDALIRYGGVYMLALAYAGTSNNKALRKVLHLAVSDVNDDVRRAAVTSIGFIYLNNPSQVPQIVELLSESFNPHVRYGACLALGISCASTSLGEALALLEPLQADSTDFVRQGALIAQSLIQIQQNNAQTLRAHLAKVIGDKHEATLAKFGAVVGQGILDGGGRNCSISLQSRHGTINMPSIVGMALFLQYWHWFPLTHFLSLSLQPTALIGLDKDLRLPKFEYQSMAKPSLFSYPAPTPPPTLEKIEKMHAVLSTSAKAQARARRRISQSATSTRRGTFTSPMHSNTPARQESMDLDGTSGPAPSPTTASASGNGGGGSPSGGHPATPTPQVEFMDIVMGTPITCSDVEMQIQRKREPSAATSGTVSAASEVKQNMTRVLPAQERYITFVGSNYQPVKSTRMSGILVMTTAEDDGPVGPFIDISADLNNPNINTNISPNNNTVNSNSESSGDAVSVSATVGTDQDYTIPDPFDYNGDTNGGSAAGGGSGSGGVGGSEQDKN